MFKRLKKGFGSNNWWSLVGVFGTESGADVGWACGAWNMGFGWFAIIERHCWSMDRVVFCNSNFVTFNELVRFRQERVFIIHNQGANWWSLRSNF